MRFSASQRDTLLKIARSAIEERLGGPPLEIPDDPWLHRDGAVFVTLRLGSRLHGCIGTVEADRPLGAAVARNAVLAAFDDPRSRPLRYTELGDVRIEVSVLDAPSPLQFLSESDAAAKLEPFVDGVVLSYGHARGVFLPQVWRSIPEPRTFLSKLGEKAGLPAGFWDPRIELSRFGVETVCEAGHDA